MRVELTTKALDRLIGGETEIEVHLRHQVLEQFARARLKALCNDETMSKLHAELAAAVGAEVAKAAAGFRAWLAAPADGGGVPGGHTFDLVRLVRQTVERELDAYYAARKADAEAALGLEPTYLKMED